MTFIEWKKYMIDAGHLVIPSRYRKHKSVSHPYTTRCGLGLKFSGLYGRCKNDPTKPSCLLTMDEYLLLAYDAGVIHEDDIGPGKGKLVMGRVGDVGDYILGNCRFITSEDNAYEKLDNGGFKSMAEKMKGVNHHTFVGYTVTPEGKFTSAIAAGEYYGCGKTRVLRNIKSDKMPDWYVSDDCDDIPFPDGDSAKYPEAASISRSYGVDNPMFGGYIHTPHGTFVTYIEAGEAIGCNPTTVTGRVNNKNFTDWYRSMDYDT